VLASTLRGWRLEVGLKRKAFPRVVLHQVRERPRLATATLCGLAAYLATSALPEPNRALLAWDVGAGLYLLLAWSMMLSPWHRKVEKMKWRARLQDDGALAVLVLTLAATVASLAAIVLELVRVQGMPRDQHAASLLLAGTTIFISWCFVHTAFALHYAHEFYVDRGGSGEPGLAFPGASPPDYLDFLYFSFVIGTTSQTADVSIVARGMRRLALVHGVFAFLFNTTLLALTVNIAAGLFGR
jgi:uncharacterized membrane protein